MIKGGLSVFKDKRVLLLQGPVGPFFQRLQQDLTQAGAQVFKVNFNGGDWLFYPDNVFNYRGKPADWPAYFEELLKQLQVDVVMLFGDCRPIHKIAHEIAHRHGLEIGVFEEGYLRPNYITLEHFGVNGNSRIPRSAIFYLNNPLPVIDPPMQMGNTFWHAAAWAVLYYAAASLLKPFFSHYQHHRPLTLLECLPWFRSFILKGYYRFRELEMQALLKGKYSGRFFLVPLQVHNDAQIHSHSNFDTVKHFINEVMESFAHHAPKNKILIIKHHPMDRGYSDYSAYISQHIKLHKLQGRCFYIHDQHLPTLLDHACGVIIVNSTVGLSALLHGTPVKVCGNALYDIQGLTYHRALNKFWREAPHSKPNLQLLKNFQNYLVVNSQLNGSFYKRLPIIASSTGLSWMQSPETLSSTVNKPAKRAHKA